MQHNQGRLRSNKEKKRGKAWKKSWRELEIRWTHAFCCKQDGLAGGLGTLISVWQAVLDLLCARNIELEIHESTEKIDQWFKQFKKL